MSKVVYSAIDFTEALKSSFIDSSIKSDNRYAPKLLSNDERSGDNVLSVLKAELADCTSFDFSIAFITSSGIQVLVEILKELEKRNIPGRILTSTYLNFNDPAALRKLLEYPNVEVRIFQGNLHAKGYFFNKNEISTIIIGSSNLTQTALTCNKEWNVLFRSYYKGDILRQVKDEFDAVWNDPDSIPNTPEWIDRYERYRKENAPKRPQASRKPAYHESEAIVFGDTSGKLTPNKMQQRALEALEVLHQRQEPRALLVSATGTGKTYLSAFDVLETQPKKVLFIAHRKRILEASRESFERVLGNRYTYSIYGGSEKNVSSCTFAMVTTLNNHLGDFDPREFDYIVIDEAHRTGANSYRKILNHFKPNFCMGMTATPSRTDGYDVYALFNHVIAFRITLQNALDEDMLAPFHYFGIADLAIDDEAIDDVSLFSKLTSTERVNHIVQKIEEYTVEKDNRRGLIFCNRNEEAAELSHMFNERGYRTVAISGETNDEDRNRQIKRLEDGEIEYIFSVDILNEGVDIPTLNQIIMLRRTESAIVFVQQLGRGLRKAPDKEYTLVLDFIGNYKQNYLVPIALSGDHTYNKDNLRRVVKEGSTAIPGCSTISFDKVSEAHIFRALEKGTICGVKKIRDEYRQLKQILGKIPTLLDFDENNAVDPLKIFRKFGSYASFLMNEEKSCGLEMSENQLKLLKFISEKIAHGKRREDLLMLQSLLTDGSASLVDGTTGSDVRRWNDAELVLSGKYYPSNIQLATRDNNLLRPSSDLLHALDNPIFVLHALQTIEFGLRRNEKLYHRPYKDTCLCLHAKYSREDACKFLGWKKEPNYQGIGGYGYNKDANAFAVFINYNKDPSISSSIQYEDRFINDRELIAISKNNIRSTNPDLIRLSNAEETGMRCYLFVRKNKEDKEDGSEFYFLGEIHPYGEFKQTLMKDGKNTAYEIPYKLENPVRPDLYDYFLSDFSVSD